MEKGTFNQEFHFWAGVEEGGRYTRECGRWRKEGYFTSDHMDSRQYEYRWKAHTLVKLLFQKPILCIRVILRENWSCQSQRKNVVIVNPPITRRLTEEHSEASGLMKTVFSAYSSQNKRLEWFASAASASNDDWELNHFNPHIVYSHYWTAILPTKPEQTPSPW